MSLELSNVKVLDSRSPFHEKIVSIHISEGMISKISEEKEGSESVNLVSPGFIDLSCAFGDPGFEHKEDLNSGLNSAQAGGFTQICLCPTTNPPIDSKNGLQYLISKSNDHLVDINPIAKISVDNSNNGFSELRDLWENGAIGFSNGIDSIDDSEFLLKSLEYSKAFNGLVINYPNDPFLSLHAQIHEGDVSTVLGLKGFPSLAEELMVQRDLRVLEYAGGRLHFSGISTKNSLELIRSAKKSGLNVTCDTPIFNLVFCDNELLDFDSLWKLKPPLRSDEHRKALIEGLKSGTIDAISTFHRPADSESKQLEFDLADFGAISLQTLIPLLFQPEIEGIINMIPEMLHYGPCRALNIEPDTIEEGKRANLTIIDPKKEWVFDSKSNLSRSKNSPLYKQTLLGKSVGVVNGTKSYFD